MDIQLKPVKKGLPGIIIELKAEKNGTEESLKRLSETALKQIQDKPLHYIYITVFLKN